MHSSYGQSDVSAILVWQNVVCVELNIIQHFVNETGMLKIIFKGNICNLYSDYGAIKVSRYSKL